MVISNAAISFFSVVVNRCGNLLYHSVSSVIYGIGCMNEHREGVRANLVPWGVDFTRSIPFVPNMRYGKVLFLIKQLKDIF